MRTAPGWEFASASLNIPNANSARNSCVADPASDLSISDREQDSSKRASVLIHGAGVEFIDENGAAPVSADASISKVSGEVVHRRERRRPRCPPTQAFQK